MLDYVTVIEEQSARFADLLAADLRSDVPSCPEWTLADLGFHLAEVQSFWATIAGDLLTSPDGVDELTRPDNADLAATFRRESARLLAALEARAPNDPCWSWDSSGGTVAWVHRRQAHEVLIHRFDAELAARVLHAPVDPELAADGVDEILTSMLSGVPGWGTFTPDGVTVTLEAVDAGPRWHATMGRFTGTSPSSGTTYDLDAMELLANAPTDVTATISGDALDLDLWLWGRADASRLHIAGDPDVATRIRQMAAESTR